MEPFTIFGLATAAIILLGGNGALRKLIPPEMKIPEDRLDNVDIIEREFKAAGYSTSLSAAAVVNAYAESKLNAKASGDSGNSIGLFQLHSKGGGLGMSVEDRQDPVINTRRIIEIITEPKNGNFGKTLREMEAEGVTDIAELTAVFCRDIERPKFTTLEMTKRRELAKKLFPSLVP